MTKTQIVRSMAERLQLKPTQIAGFFDWDALTDAVLPRDSRRKGRESAPLATRPAGREAGQPASTL